MKSLFEKYRDVYREGMRICKSEQAADVLRLGIAYCQNDCTNGILVAGINPSYRDKQNPPKGFEEDHCSFALEKVKSIGIWRNIKRLYNDEFKGQVAYLDMFPIRCTHQKGRKDSFEHIFEHEIDIKVKLLTITQEEIERLSPKIIVIHNKQSWAYWGGVEHLVWMGYHFKEISKLNSRIDIYEIDGMRDGRICPGLQTKLIGTKVVCYGLYDERLAKKLGFNLQDDLAIIRSFIKENYKNEVHNR